MLSCDTFRLFPALYSFSACEPAASSLCLILLPVLNLLSVCGFLGSGLQTSSRAAAFIKPLRRFLYGVRHSKEEALHFGGGFEQQVVTMPP